MLLNYWGYSTVGFFAPKAGYAATGKLGMQVDEFKALVKDLHKNGIEVILDVVFNHTAEGNENGPISFRGLTTKHITCPDGYYYNLVAAATHNCNQLCATSCLIVCATGRRNITLMASRFDLASILGRDPGGSAG